MLLSNYKIFTISHKFGIITIDFFMFLKDI